jgi:hypothetical protein
MKKIKKKTKIMFANKQKRDEKDILHMLEEWMNERMLEINVPMRP